MFHSANAGGGGNRARYRNAAIDARLEELERTPDAAARAEMARAVDAAVAADAPWIYLWHPIREAVTSERVKGWTPHPVPSGERWIEAAPRVAAAR